MTSERTNFRLPRTGLPLWLFAAAVAALIAFFGPTASGAWANGDRDAAAVAQHVAAGGPVPSWANSPSLAAALIAEAQSHGLPWDAAASNPPDHGTLVIALRLAHALAAGEIVPTSVQDTWIIPPPSFDPRAALATLATLDDPLLWLRSLAPQHAEYQRLRGALADYRALAENGGWPVVPQGPILRRGVSDPRLPVLRQRLKVEGDLAADAGGASSFDAATEQAVRHFQVRHGIMADGRVGRDTLAAMNVDAWSRYRTIAANLERWRWLPHELPETRIVVNAAAARLSLFENSKVALQLRTIAGTRKHPTPVLNATVVSLVFNPPWDIPLSIAAKEIRPTARRDPGYLEREGIVERNGDRLRQLPGPKNALGRIKLEMPNRLDVYLHDTPSKQLFASDSRYYSHGCIRVEHTDELALRLLGDQPQWSAEAIEGAIATGVTQRVPIIPQVPVYVLYFTAIGDEGGAVTFYDDVYDRDAPLIAALFANAAVAESNGENPAGEKLAAACPIKEDSGS